MLSFGSRLQQLTERKVDGAICPQFDRGGDRLSSSFDCIVLAMPPKDILRFFHVDSGPDNQSQADLHRRTNKGHHKRRRVLSDSHRKIKLEKSVLEQLRTPSFNGRYSLAQWFDRGNDFVAAVCAGWDRCEGSRDIDMISSQPGGVLIVQSTVELWRRVEGGGRQRGRGKRKGRHGGRGGGRKAALAQLVSALENSLDEKCYVRSTQIIELAH